MDVAVDVQQLLGGSVVCIDATLLQQLKGRRGGGFDTVCEMIDVMGQRSAKVRCLFEIHAEFVQVEALW